MQEELRETHRIFFKFLFFLMKANKQKKIEKVFTSKNSKKKRNLFGFYFINKRENKKKQPKATKGGVRNIFVFSSLTNTQMEQANKREIRIYKHNEVHRQV